MKLLYLPNESLPNWQMGARVALKRLQELGILSELEIFSFLQRPPTTALAEILSLAQRLEPDVILFTKIDKFPVTASWFDALKAVRSTPLIAYYDADIYGRVFKRFTPQMAIMSRYADEVFLCGLGSNAQLFESNGAKSISLCPHSASLRQFGSDWTPTPDRKFDVVLIGNRIQSRLGLLNHVRWGRMPGAFDREALVRRLGSVFGKRFAVFGRGWDGFPGNHGTVPFDRQLEILRSSWISVGYEHFPGTPFYFSDRLPIALLSGVAHAVHFHPGYDILFGNGCELLWADSPEQLVDVVHFALSMGPAFLDELGKRGREFALARLTADVAYGNMIQALVAARSSATKRTSDEPPERES